jgi:thymidine phosphorylase
MVQAQGGNPRVADEPERVLPAAPVRRPITAERAGTLATVDAEALGRASGDLGAGRKKKGDPIDPSVGIVFEPKVGDRLEAGQEVGWVHARSDEDADVCIRTVNAALTLAEGPVDPPPLVYGWHG